MANLLGAGVLLALALGACGRTGVRDYVASPVLSEQDWGDRLHLARAGVRVIAGPVAVFPYEREGAEGAPERGQYQLFTRVVVHNVGREPVDVVWSEAALEVPGGGRIRLIDTSVATGASTDAAPPLVERVEPGHRTARALIPETVREIGVGEPMVPLCDGCEYRLVIVVRSGGRHERLMLPFRLSVREPEASVLRPSRRDRED
ncbi:MAG TPA: hypothetical protein VF212_06620 [Longimicrobiales bacterium]